MRRFLLTISVVGLLTGCGDHAADARKDNDHTNKLVEINPKLADATNRVGFALLHQLSKDGATVLISPASIDIALSMTYNGAAGETQSGMAKALSLDGMSSDELNSAQKKLREQLLDSASDITLSIANSLWSKNGYAFDTTFLANARDFYSARISELDFANPDAPLTINGWVKENTRGKITKMIDEIPDNAILYLLNAIYFKGTWTYQFDKAKTSDLVFHHPSGDRPRPLMALSTDFDYFEDSLVQAVRLPYGESQQFAMIVLLPRDNTTLAALTDSLSFDRWNTWMSELSTRAGTVRLPRFTLNYEAGLNEPLTAMGMGKAFDPTGADFSKMISGVAGNVYITAVKHKTFIEVNEEGTEAAAVTSVEVGITSFTGPPPPFTMIVDRPFFCAIADRESGLILFMGTVSEFE